MYSYQLYGLTFQSTFQLLDVGELPSPLQPDVTIQLVSDGCVSDYVPSEVAQQPIALQIDRMDALVYLQNTGVFLVQGGCKIVVVSAQHAEQEQICQAVLGVVLAVLLYQRGLYILHGSAAAIEDMAIAFLGDSGAGKSSALAAVVDQGFIGVTDDLTALDPSITPLTIYPGVPRIKLSAAVASQLQLAPSSICTADESTFSLATPLHSFVLHNLYILEYDCQWSIEPIPKSQAIIELLRFAGLKSVLPVRNRYHFQQAAQLANDISLYKLRRPRDLSQLDQLPKLLKEHIRSTHFKKNSLEYNSVT